MLISPTRLCYQRGSRSRDSRLYLLPSIHHSSLPHLGIFHRYKRRVSSIDLVIKNELSKATSVGITIEMCKTPEKRYHLSIITSQTKPNNVIHFLHCFIAFFNV